MSKRLLDVLEADGGWLTAEGAALEAGISDQAAKRALHRFRNGGQVETRFADGHNEWRFMEGSEPPRDQDEETPVTTSKTCSRCKETKPVDQFGKNKSTPDGLSYYCKACQKARYREKAAKKTGAPKTPAPKPESAKVESKPEPVVASDEDTHWCIAELRDPRLSTVVQAQRMLEARLDLQVTLEDTAGVLSAIADLDLA